MALEILKKQRKVPRAIYAAVTFVSVAAIIFLILKMLFSGQSPDVPEHKPDIPLSDNDPSLGTLRIRLTEVKAESLIADYLPEESMLSDISVSFSSDGTVALSGKADKRQIIEEAQKNNINIGFISIIMPSKIGFVLSSKPEVADGKVSIKPQALKISGHSLPVSLVPSQITGELDTYINNSISGSGMKIKNISVADGYMDIYLK